LRPIHCILLCALGLAGLAAPAPAQYKEACDSGRALQREGKLAEAGKEFQRAMTLATTPAERVNAQLAAVTVLLAEKRNVEARAELARLLDAADTPPGNRPFARLLLGKTWFAEGNWAAARKEFAAVSADDSAAPAHRADAQLHLGLCDYEARDFAAAKTELEKLAAMPGATPRQLREAALRLRLRRLVPVEPNTLAVLFIGASHTQVWDIPRAVEALAASAPPGSPRILAGEYLRGGTGIHKFWEEGDGPGTARARVAAEPWDFVVFECYPFLFTKEQCLKYARLFSDLARAGKAVPVLFDAPVFVRTPYPDGARANHDDNVAIARSLGIPLAAAGHAWTLYLGPAPTPEQRMALYHPDAVHTSPKGAYLIACSIYAAVTKLTPVGLTRDIPGFPENALSADDAAALQAAAWTAWRESNPVE
jgi:hypothetical protein